MRAIRAIDQFKTLPIIAVTGKVMAGERQRCLDAGANDYVPKPVDTAELFAALRPWLPTAAQPARAAVPLVGKDVIRPAGHSAPLTTPDDSGGERADPGFDRRHSGGQTVSAVGRAKILVVDDDFRNIFALSALLERANNADVIVAESGPEALAQLDKAPDIDIVLMDIMMPVMDGYETIRAIRAIDQFKDLPIIAVTGKVMAWERQRCIDAGANDYVPKPVDTH